MMQSQQKKNNSRLGTCHSNLGMLFGGSRTMKLRATLGLSVHPCELEHTLPPGANRRTVDTSKASMERIHTGLPWDPLACVISASGHVRCAL